MAWHADSVRRSALVRRPIGPPSSTRMGCCGVSAATIACGRSRY